MEPNAIFRNVRKVYLNENIVEVSEIYSLFIESVCLLLGKC